MSAADRIAALEGLLREWQDLSAGWWNEDKHSLISRTNALLEAAPPSSGEEGVT